MQYIAHIASTYGEAMKLILVTLIALIVGLIVSCGGGSDEYQYPKETAENYVEACVFK